MAYNNYFPAGYPQYTYPQGYTQYQQQPVVQQPQNNSGIVWIQGESAAKAYPVAPGNSVLLMDSEDSVFYIKSADASGMPLPLRIFDYTERTQQIQPHAPVANTPQVNFSDYVTKEELETRLAQFMPQISTTPAIVKKEAKKEK